MKKTAEKDTTVMELLQKLLAGASNSTIKQYLKFGGVTLNGEPVKIATTPVPAGAVVEVNKVPQRKGPATPFNLVYEDGDILVANKPAGVLSAGEGITRKPTLHKLVDGYIKHESNGKKHAFVVHRLDKEVSGLIVFAKSEEMQEKLKNDWGRCTKKYLALTSAKPDPEQGTIDTWLFEYKQKMEPSSADAPGAVNAISHYKYLGAEGRNHLTEVTLETGKKNQIRAHLTHIGCPIIGDRKYGDSSEEELQVRLLAYFLEIPHPRNGKLLNWTIKPDAAFLSPGSPVKKGKNARKKRK